MDDNTKTISGFAVDTQLGRVGVFKQDIGIGVHIIRNTTNGPICATGEEENGGQFLQFSLSNEAAMALSRLLLQTISVVSEPKP